ncbi:hypothetical protein RR48_11919 [Papilio machaon]|uniref:Uncharacterized protein n=1 Tax=Papilio machaon TaxID=76193 RepID=A0A194RPX3_PAPMA|nr:hypothetical protein RR48_11919 [Papilio machaon]
MLAEKKMSSKINYDILKSLDQPGSLVTASTTVPATPTASATPTAPTTPTVPTTPARTVILSNDESKLATPKETVPPSPVPRKRKKKDKGAATPAAPPTPSPKLAQPTPSPKPAPPTPKPTTETEIADDYDEDLEPEVPEVNNEMSLAAMLQNGDDDDYYGYDEY